MDYGQKPLDVGNFFLYYSGMGKLYEQSNWLIRVQGNEHLPVHVHVLHPDGRAVIGLDGSMRNTGVPASVLAKAAAWVAVNADIVRAEWARMSNPPDRRKS
jgi:hypothetical protein